MKALLRGVFQDSNFPTPDGRQYLCWHACTAIHTNNVVNCVSHGNTVPYEVRTNRR